MGQDPVLLCLEIRALVAAAGMDHFGSGLTCLAWIGLRRAEAGSGPIERTAAVSAILESAR
jgi:hypothetical protein